MNKFFCFSFRGNSNRPKIGEARVMGRDLGEEADARQLRREQARTRPSGPEGRRETEQQHRDARTEIGREAEQNFDELKAATEQEITRARHDLEDAHLEAGMGQGTMQAAVENLERKFDELSGNPELTAFRNLNNDAESVRGKIQQWVRHQELMEQARRRGIENDPRIAEIRRKLTGEGPESTEARNNIQTHNETLQNILAEHGEARAETSRGETAERGQVQPPEAANAPQNAPAEQQPQSQEEANEQPMSWINTIFSAVGGFIGGALGAKISHMGESLQNFFTKLASKMPLTVRYALGLSNERLRQAGVAVETSDDLDPTGTGLSAWRVAVMNENDLRIYVRASRRLDMVSEATRGKILEMKVAEFLRKLPNQITDVQEDRRQIASLQQFIRAQGAQGNKIVAASIAEMADAQWAEYRPEGGAATAGAAAIEANRPGETPLTPAQRTDAFFASVRTALSGALSVNAEQDLRRLSAQGIARGTAQRPAAMNERAWNTVANALRGQQISDTSMTVEQWLQRQFEQNPNRQFDIA